MVLIANVKSCSISQREQVQLDMKQTLPVHWEDVRVCIEFPPVGSFDNIEDITYFTIFFIELQYQYLYW